MEHKTARDFIKKEMNTTRLASLANYNIKERLFLNSNRKNEHVPSEEYMLYQVSKNKVITSQSCFED